MLDLDSLTKEVIQIAANAGHSILQIYNESEDIQFSKKDDNSPLTIADKTANTIICAGLEKLDPLFPIISEENKEIPYEERKDFETFWQVDPLDGTKEFIKRNGEFTVNIALVHQQRPILGVVYTPCTGEMFYAYKEGGAFLSKGEENKRIKSNAFTLDEKGLRMVCSRSHLNEETRTYVEKFDKPELVAKGSSLKFMILAEGKADIYPRLAPTMEWDTCAAQIILEEAGGAVIDQNTNKPLVYNKEVLLNPHFIAFGNLSSQS